ncbi:glycoside hydrolase family 76 protein [Sphingobacterium sp. T2]|uniref:glycoside hydrolase family 76 protein n=1 Tax=Sphingobacterium sp. T2 TaxID=1590596 RepID=UPI0009E4458E|nr:glycoside hydrolase family 76 protein [Sphingobacterium sp. T2]
MNYIRKRTIRIVYRYIDSRDRKTRKVKKLLKRDYYLMFAKKIYHWQKGHLLNDQGVYWDMMGQCSPDCQIRYEEVGGQRYRGHTQLLKATGKPYSYNSGTMLSGAVDLYRATKQKDYLDDAKALAKASFLYFDKGRQAAQRVLFFSYGWF